LTVSCTVNAALAKSADDVEIDGVIALAMAAKRGAEGSAGEVSRLDLVAGSTRTS
jgi:hypothetical protein